MRFFVQKFLVFGFLIFIQFFVVSFAYAVVTRATPSLGLVGWWKMDESSWNGTSGEIRDSTWYARNGTSYSGATTAAGKFTRAGYFDGNNDYAQYSASIIPLGAKTVAFWFNDSTPINTEGDIVSTTNGSPSHGMIIYRADTSGKITCLSTKGTAGTMRFGLASTRSFNDGAWHHVACVWDGTTNANGAKLYIDGVADGQATAVATETTAQTYSLTLGKTPSASGNWYRGFLDDLRIYSRALSAGEIAVLYASKPATATNVNKTVAKNNSAVNLQNGLVGHWTFDGKNMTATQATDIAGGNTGTLTGGVTKVTGKIGQGLKFDGGSGYVNLGSVAALNPTNITVSAWVFAKNIPAGGVSYYGMQNAGGNIYRATDVDASGNLYWMQSDGSGNRRWYQTNSPVLSLNKWYHVVVTQTGATAPSIFVDGVLAPSSVVLSQGNEVVPSTQISTIGRQGAWATDLYWNGYVDDVRIYNRALNAAEIAALYTAGAPTKTSVTNTNKLTSGLVGYWTFDGKNMTATQATDIAGGNTGTLTGGVTKVAGKIGQALKFDGSSGYINTSYLSQLGANSFSMSFWFKLRHLSKILG